MQFYNKYRNGIYTPSDYCMPVIAKYGTGGGNTPLVVQTVTDNGFLHRKRTGESALPSANSGSAELYGRSTEGPERERENGQYRKKIDPGRM